MSPSYKSIHYSVINPSCGGDSKQVKLTSLIHNLKKKIDITPPWLYERHAVIR